MDPNHNPHFDTHATSDALNAMFLLGALSDDTDDDDTTAGDAPLPLPPRSAGFLSREIHPLLAYLIVGFALAIIAWLLMWPLSGSR